jgi:putative ABC transport system permease protein
MDSVWKDFRFAVRVLWKSPGFSAVALLALVLGIGANTAIFSVVNAVLLRPMPFVDPGRLVSVRESSPQGQKDNVANPQNVSDWQKRNHSFEKIAGYIPFELTMSLTGGGSPEEVPGNYVTRDFFPLLGVQPALGRNFLPEEELPNTPDVALLSDGFWRRRFGADPHIAGKKLMIGGNLTIVIGVLPATFRFPDVKADIWGLTTLHPERQRKGRYLAPIARMRPGVTVSQAQADMNVIMAQLAREYPDFNTNWGVTVIPLRQQFTGDLKTPLLVLLGAVGLVLLIACANVANLMLMRSSARQREMAIRTSLGATRARIVRQLLVESMILGVAGGGLGLLVAVWAKDVLLAMLPESMSVAKVNAVAIDGNVLAFTVTLSLGTALLFGLLPALRASRPDLSDTLKEGGRAVSSSLRRNRMRAALVAGEMAVAMMLLIGAGLLIRSFIRLEHVTPGFQPDRILSMRIGLSNPRYKKDLKLASAGLDEILQRIAQVPGVVSTGSIQFPPLGGLLPATGYWVAGRPTPNPSEAPVTGVSIVTPGYFPTMGIPLINGRLFTERDQEGTPQVTIVSQSLARQEFPNMNPIGQRLFVEWGRETPYQIVGVVGDVKHDGLEKEVRPTVYFPNAQETQTIATLMIRTGGDPMQLAPVAEQIIHAYDKDQAIAKIQPLDMFLSKAVARPRFQSVLLASFAGLALLLAAIGTFGVMSYSVAQRTHEIGIRVALGAQRDQVLRLIVGQGLLLALIGTAAGLAGAFALTRYLKTLLFNVSPTDWLTFTTVPIALCAVALAASYLPARRAMQVDPMQALRYE